MSYPPVAASVATRVLHVGQPVIPPRADLDRYLNRAIDAEWLTNDGPLVQELEAKLSDYLGVEHVICVSSATVGLQLAAVALGLRNRPVAVPSWTFPASATALSWIGAIPVFSDVEEATHLLSPSFHSLPVLGVHLWGNVCAARGPITLYDAAHAFQPGVAGLGDATVFSFHATKTFHTVEGGAITTTDAVLARELRRLRNFGYDGDEAISVIGINAKMSEVHAAWGLALLPSILSICAENEERCRLYKRFLPVPFLTHPPGSTHQYIVAQVEHRDAILSTLHSANVLAKRYFFPGLHRTPAYAKLPRCTLPITDALAATTLVLPNGPHVSFSDIERICAIIEPLL